jgi:tripartite-type tricarboxylate transporter receptor subunit TctC
MISFKKCLPLIAAAAVVFAGIQLSSDAQAKEYYEGKTVTVLVGFSAGGGTDTAARIFSKHFGKHIPGKPHMVVKNMPGGGSIKAHNFLFEKAKPDGLTILYTPVQFPAQVLGSIGVRFDYARFTWVGPLIGESFMMFARTDIVPGGIKKSSDFIKAKRVKFAGIRPTVALDMLGRPTLDLLGIKYTYIPGYRGAAKIRLAIRAGEANVAVHGLIGWRSGVEPTMAKEGIVKALWYYPLKDEKGNFVKSPTISDMPTFIDVYKEIYGKEPSGPYWEALKFLLDLRGTVTNVFVGPPNMNKNALAALRTGFGKMIRDPGAIADQKKSIGFNYKPVSIAVAEKFVAGLKNVDPNVVKFWKDYIAQATGAK